MLEIQVFCTRTRDLRGQRHSPLAPCSKHRSYRACAPTPSPTHNTTLPIFRIYKLRLLPLHCSHEWQVLAHSPGYGMRLPAFGVPRTPPARTQIFLLFRPLLRFPNPLVCVRPPLVGIRGLRRRSSLIPGPGRVLATVEAARRGWYLSYLCHVIGRACYGEEKNNVFTSLDLASPTPTFPHSMLYTLSLSRHCAVCARVRLFAHEGQSASVKKYDSMDG